MQAPVLLLVIGPALVVRLLVEEDATPPAPAPTDLPANSTPAPPSP